MPIRDMWKAPEQTLEEKKKAKVDKKAEKKVMTVVKQVKDMELFETEFADTEDEESGSNSGSDVDDSVD